MLARGEEVSPSPVYGAALLMRFGLNAHRGFKSLRLRHVMSQDIGNTRTLNVRVLSFVGAGTCGWDRG